MRVISPSVKTCGFDTFLIRGRQGLQTFVPWLLLMGGSWHRAAMTEGEKPLPQNLQANEIRYARYLSFRQNLRF